MYVAFESFIAIPASIVDCVDADMSIFTTTKQSAGGWNWA
jgi:hypothetical protein